LRVQQFDIEGNSLKEKWSSSRGGSFAQGNVAKLYMAISSNYLTPCGVTSSMLPSAGFKKQDLVKNMELVEEGHE
jgi:hypothetical protein